MTLKRYTILCQATGPSLSDIYAFEVGTGGVYDYVEGELWSTDSFEDANQKCIDLATETGAFTYQIRDRDRNKT